MRIYTVLSIVVLIFLVSVTACDPDYWYSRGYALGDDAEALAVEYIEANEWLRYLEGGDSYEAYVSITYYVRDEGEPSEADAESLLEDLIAMGQEAYAEHRAWFFREGIGEAMTRYKVAQLLISRPDTYGIPSVRVPPVFEYYDMIKNAVEEGID